MCDYRTNDIVVGCALIYVFVRLWWESDRHDFPTQEEQEPSSS